MRRNPICIVCGSRRAWIPTRWEGKPAYLCSICAGVQDEPRYSRRYAGSVGGVKVGNPKGNNPTMIKNRNDAIAESAVKKFTDSFSKPIRIKKPNKIRLANWQKTILKDFEVSERDREEAWKRGVII